ncbi:HET domain-containing protein [Bombardia bombarda]|uniref:HET domain-containing protein n=1 Tax=Bombardia bombarda TaxID=252184 RepID=A0AA40BVW7_9PEZI|nr:HET domain-containing protein [Bombardia bombarda]
MTCNICNQFQGTRDLRKQGEGFREGVRNHVKTDFSWDEFMTSAKSCYICNLLVRGTRACFRQRGLDESQILDCGVYFYYEQAVDDGLDIDKDIRFRMKDGSRFEVQLFAVDDDDDDNVSGSTVPDYWESIPASKRTSPKTDSDLALTKARSWLDDCIENHVESSFCTTPAEAELPTRVLHVGLDDGVIRLIETHGKVARYICLSHCWGQAQIITTTKSTLPDRMREIPMHALSNTFRDAILLTRRLGVQYIWIDSMCILQDDIDDWNFESARMMDVYSRAYLTIAATHSSDGNGGLFVDTPDVEISGTTPSGDKFTLFFRERIDHHLDVAQEAGIGISGHPTSTFYPLLTRAWVYQERMLSTRVLHFGRYEIFFECRSDIMCECGNIEFHGMSETAPMALTKMLHAEALDTVAEGMEWHIYAQHYICRMWHTMVSSYTCLGLTKPGDRLPAMGGLAKHMAIRRKSVYLAGLWENTLNEDLLWSVYTTSLFKKARPSPRSAPTWSWASVETYILYLDEILYWDPDYDGEMEERPPYEHFARVQECRVKSAAIDEYGKVEKGHLQILGLVATGILEREEVDTLKNGKNTLHYVSFPSGMRLRINADYLLDAPGPDQVPPGTEVSCLRMTQMQSSEITDNLISLVLRRVAGEQHNGHDVFERIGSMLVNKSPPPVDVVGPYGSATEKTLVII